jgi:enoyl-CoA hydratase/carnithine racemase
LVTRVVPRARLDEEAMAVAQQLAALPQRALRATKEAMTLGVDMPLEAGLRLESLIAARAVDEPDTA